MAHVSGTRILRSTGATVLTLLVGVGLVALGVLLAATEAPGGARDLRAYEAAARCPAAPSAPADCRWTQEFTVADMILRNSRRGPNRLVLTGADGTRRETTYDSGGPVFEKGERVTGTLWRGLLTEISSGDFTQQTDDAPADMRARVLIFALVTVPSGLLVTAACAWRLGRRAIPDPTPGMVATMGLAVGLFFAGLFSPLFVGGRGDDLWRVAAVWLPVAAVLTVVARVYVIRKRAADTVTGEDAHGVTPAGRP
ncbi:hypothetical protein AB0L00_14105 [Actinoallomurus sp. NPDC052308]|uniref:hypothetical protein n=1 Tax=Actinoallomurus sp. NPDC052308 TaxID=3155530 RepID=UPI00342FB173